MDVPFRFRWTSTLRFVLVVLALQVPSWLTAWFFQGPRAEERPLFNLDFLLAAAIACFSSLAGGVVLVLAWAADLTRAAAKNYHFMSTADFVDGVRFLHMLNLSSFISVSLLVLVLGSAVCGWIVLRETRHRRLMALPLLTAAVLAVGGDIANGSFHIFGLDKDSRIVNANFAGSPIWNVWRSERQSQATIGPLVPMENPAVYRALRAWQETHVGQTSMLVLVESMGLPRDPRLTAWLRGRLATPRLEARWTIQQSADQFHGSTTSGELRTLCGLQGHYSRLDDRMAAGCLPRQVAARGGRSIGIHGFGLRMFDRSEWWPKIGLTPWQWAEDPQGTRPMNCNQAFPGVCDGAVLDQAVRAAQQPGRFVYALTLDTHLPLDRRQHEPPSKELRMACERSATPDEACQLVQRLGNVLGRLEQALAGAQETPYVVVVGDHAPPFGERENREVFAADRVPMFELEPKSASTGSSEASPAAAQ